MTYVSSVVEDVVLSREAMETLKIVENLDDRKKAVVNLVSSVVTPYYSKSSSPVTCGCFVRSEAPDPISHKDVGGFDSMS